MKKKKDEVLIQKIEVDKKTNEPRLIQLSETELADIDKETDNTEIKKPNDVSIKDMHKQIVMTQVFGFDNKPDVSKRQKVFKTLITILFIVFVVGILVYTAYNDFSGTEPLPSWQTVSATFSETWFYLLFALVSLAANYLLKGLKMSIMCKSMTGKFHFVTCLETGIVGHYYNNITPLAVGGQPFEIYHLSKHGIHGGVASSLPIASYIVNQFGFITLGIVALALYSTNTLKIPNEMIGVMPDVVSIIAIVGLSLCLLMPAIVVLFSLLPKLCAKIVYFVIYLGKKLRIVKDAKKTTYSILKTVVQNSKCLKKIASNPLVFALSFIISLCEHLAQCSIAYFVLRFFGFDWPAWNIWEWAQVIQLCIILYAAISFVPTPGNSGVADLSFYLLFKTGLGNNTFAGFAFPAMLLWRFLSFYSYIIIGFAFTKLKKKADLKKEKAE